MHAGDFSGLLGLGGQSLLRGVGLVTALFPKWGEAPSLQACSSTSSASGACSHWYPITLGAGWEGRLQLIPVIYGEFLFPQQPQKTQLCPIFAHRSVPPPQPVCHMLQCPAVTQCLPQAVQEGRPPATPAWLGEEKPLPATPSWNNLNYPSGEAKKKGDSRPLKVSRSNLVHGISSVLICCSLWAGGSCHAHLLSHEPRKAVLSLSVMNVSSIITAPEGEKGRIAVHRGPKISIIFLSPPSLCTILPCAAKEKSPPEVTLSLSWIHMTLLLRILHPLCLTEVMKTKLLALCLFSVIFSVCCQQPEPWPFPIQGITVSSESTQGWQERCRRQQPSWAYVKKNKVKASPRFTVLCAQGTGSWA